MGKRPQKLEHVLSQFLFQACVDFGFCLPPSIQEKLIVEQSTTATQFVKKVMLAEGINPQNEKHHFRTLHDLLLEMVGSEILSEFEDRITN